LETDRATPLAVTVLAALGARPLLVWGAAAAALFLAVFGRRFAAAALLPGAGLHLPGPAARLTRHARAALGLQALASLVARGVTGPRALRIASDAFSLGIPRGAGEEGEPISKALAT